MQHLPRKAKIFWPLFLTVFLADCTTKEAAVEHLSPPGTPHEILGDVFRLTLTYNDGAAMGLPVGGATTAFLGLISVLVAVLVLFWYLRIPKDDKLLSTALALLIAGALGNGWQRLFHPQGVVDFFDFGLRSHRFYVFNVADIGITVGAALLGVLLWLEKRNPQDQTPDRGVV